MTALCEAVLPDWFVSFRSLMTAAKRNLISRDVREGNIALKRNRPTAAPGGDVALLRKLEYLNAVTAWTAAYRNASPSRADA
jgi:hypothetical protein